MVVEVTVLGARCLAYIEKYGNFGQTKEWLTDYADIALEMADSYCMSICSTRGCMYARVCEGGVELFQSLTFLDLSHFVCVAGQLSLFFDQVNYIAGI